MPLALETTHRATPSNHRAFPSLDRPADAVKHLGPNWFAAVMGTGIVATAAISLPVQVAGQRGFALAVWVVAATLLLLLLAATAAHWLRHPQLARGHISHPVMSHFYGAPPMAMLTVGAGALLVGKDLIGLRAAVDLDWVLWIAGTITGLLSAAIVPYYAFTRHEYKPESAFGGWLMPIVPPMVSASTGALLVPYAAAGQPRETLLLGCYVMFGMSLFASIVIISLIWGRLTQHKVGAAAAVPTLWIVLGPLGQSVTAAGLMGSAAVGVLPAPYAAGAAALALFYSLATWGFAMLWLAIAATITVRTAREHLPFTLTWWSFTFPLGTVVMGTSGLARRTGLDVFAVAAVVLYLFLLAAWCTVFIRTARGAANGHLLLPPTAVAALAPLAKNFQVS
jgi:C4-dicarboxylate transporter/malic acid transport protein